MDPIEWKRVSDVFGRALDLPGSERAAWVQRELATLPTLLEEVLSLLDASGQANAFLEDSLSTRALSLMQSSEASAVRSGDRIGDFQILEQIGSGSFATVFRATQISLGREVALKISPDFGDEAKNMAPLEHDHIVRVFVQSTCPDKKLRLLCMQFVPGITLETLIRELATSSFLGGRAWLEILDRLSPQTSLVDFKSLALRTELSELDSFQSVLWIGKQMAEALTHAHKGGVLHLDVKPGNILINPLGRAYLTDFNVALPENGSHTSLIGGTLRYMSPEQRRWFEGKSGANHIDARSDVYSLGLVLRELFAAGFPNSMRAETQKLVREMEAILDRATHANPDLRFRSAEEMAEVLEGALQRSLVLKALPGLGSIHRMESKAPILAFAAWTMLPAVLGSLVNISYNALRIVNNLTSAQQELFQQIVVAFNVVAYPVCFALSMRYVLPPLRHLGCPEWNLLPGELARLRRRALATPSFIAAILTLGWAACAIVFPLALHLFEGPLSANVALHFFISFGLSWIIAVSYSFLFTQSMTLRVVYPALCVGTRRPRTIARRELGTLPRRMKAFHYISGLLPLLVAGVLVVWGPALFHDTGSLAFRVLLSALLAIAGLGFVMSLSGARELETTFNALTGSDGERTGQNLPRPLRTSTVRP